MGILDDKKLLITGVLTDASLAYSVARLAQEQGAEIILTGAGRGMRLTQRTAKKLPVVPEVLEFDVTSAEQASALQNELDVYFQAYPSILLQSLHQYYPRIPYL